MKLVLGVLDIPYENGQTTGDVAEILEAKYHIMETFSEVRELEMADAMADGMAGALESLMMGAPPSLDPFGDGTSAIENMFKDALSNREFDGLINGVPTRAAVKGKSNRFKSKKSGGSRPSFIDTGQYQASFKAWVEVGE